MGRGRDGDGYVSSGKIQFLIEDEDGQYVDVKLDWCANISLLFGNYCINY